MPSKSTNAPMPLKEIPKKRPTKAPTSAKGSAQKYLTRQRSPNKTPTPDTTKIQLKGAMGALAEQVRQQKRKRENAGTSTPKKKPNASADSPLHANTNTAPTTRTSNNSSLLPITPYPNNAQLRLAANTVNDINSTDYPTLAPNTVDSAWLDRVSNAMIDVAIRQGPIYSAISMFTTDWDYGKLRVLAALGYIPTWWWIRECLVAMVVRRGVLVKDEAMVKGWKEAEDKIRERDERGEKVGNSDD